jgi:DNA-binding NarL/FixJ family response regulator
MLYDFPCKGVREAMEHLTQREIAVLDFVKNGLENHEIAQKIYVSRHTVKAHLSSIIHKTAARNRTHLVYLAFKQGLVD